MSARFNPSRSRPVALGLPTRSTVDEQKGGSNVTTFLGLRSVELRLVRMSYGNIIRPLFCFGNWIIGETIFIAMSTTSSGGMAAMATQ